ncbi:MAG TPA: hypothetical protein VNJ01_16570 [Bacteriovoracaceae bacterium]|nr:hypothetical protein [Bacteriovoracaceae bacterium]
MKNIFLPLLFLILASCSSHRIKQEGPLEITEIHPNKMTALTHKHLVQLSRKHDLSPFLYTTKVQIESFVTPRSHPVLTLNTRSAKSPDKVLAVLLHEEFHWWATSNSANTDRAISDLKAKYPKIPGQDELLDDRSNYLHLVICWLEYKAVVKFLGEERALTVINETIKTDKIYPLIYTQVLKHQKDIETILKKHKLIPKALAVKSKT